jgi:hypothetical protein
MNAAQLGKEIYNAINTIKTKTASNSTITYSSADSTRTTLTYSTALPTGIAQYDILEFSSGISRIIQSVNTGSKTITFRDPLESLYTIPATHTVYLGGEIAGSELYYGDGDATDKTIRIFVSQIVEKNTAMGDLYGSQTDSIRGVITLTRLFRPTSESFDAKYIKHLYMLDQVKDVLHNSLPDECFKIGFQQADIGSWFDKQDGKKIWFYGANLQFMYDNRK